MGLPALGIIAIIGFKNTASKIRLILASVAAPFLFLVGRFLFFNILPYAAYTTHWLKAENVIRATNGPAEYYNKYLTRWEIELNRKQYGKELGLNLTSKDMLRARVAANYLSKEQLAYYISKAYPEYAESRGTQNKNPKASELPKDYKGELFPHFSYEGLEYVGEFYQNYAYTNVDDAGV